jgi:hypothetical protein
MSDDRHNVPKSENDAPANNTDRLGLGDAVAAVLRGLQQDDLKADHNKLATAYGIVKRCWRELDEKLKNGASLRTLAASIHRNSGCEISPETLGVYIRRFRAEAKHKALLDRSLNNTAGDATHGPSAPPIADQTDTRINSPTEERTAQRTDRPTIKPIQEAVHDDERADASKQENHVGRRLRQGRSRKIDDIDCYAYRQLALAAADRSIDHRL